MAQKFKPSTKIPTFPKPTLLKSASSTLNLNSNNGNTGLRSLKPLVTRGPRRSKSVTDFRSLHTRTNDVNKPSNVASFLKNTLKRPAVTKASTVPNKICKESKPESAKPASKPKQPTIAPYDYKSRFNRLKEIHEELKVKHRDLKDLHEETADNYEDLLTKSTQQQNDFDTLQQLHDQLRKEHLDIKGQYEIASSQIGKLQTKSDKLQTELNEKIQTLDCTTKELEAIREINFKIQTKLSSTEKQLEENIKTNTCMKEELSALLTESRKNRNTIQELKGNIRVFCRIRPPLTGEKDKLLYDINYLNETSIELHKSKDKKMEFSFDKVFGPTTNQKLIFEELHELVQSTLDGYNVCVFAYGQTGSGKTYTMEGEYNPDTRGMIPRAIDTIFCSLESLKRLGWTYKIKASFLEIYNENVVDLLDPKKGSLDIRMCDAKGTDVYVTNLTIEDIQGADKLITLMKTAQRNRAVAATENNERSSRSHSVTKISLEGMNEELGQKCRGVLNLIDLAGSEKYHTNEITRLRETVNINKSLSNLSNVILSLVNKVSHVPYRNSKLTHLLMPSLGGNSKTLMLVNISPLEECYNESVNSLRFASTVNQCKTGSIKKQKTNVNI